MSDYYTLPSSLRGLVGTMLPRMDIDKIHVTGWYGEPRATHPHWAYDVQGKGNTTESKGKDTEVCSPIEGTVLLIEESWGAVYIVVRNGVRSALGSTSEWFGRSCCRYGAREPFR